MLSGEWLVPLLLENYRHSVKQTSDRCSHQSQDSNRDSSILLDRHSSHVVSCLNVQVLEVDEVLVKRKIELAIESLEMLILDNVLNLVRIPLESEVEFLELWLVHLSLVANYSNLGKLILWRDSNLAEQLSPKEIDSLDTLRRLIWQAIHMGASFFLKLQGSENQNVSMIWLDAVDKKMFKSRELTTA